LFTHSQIIRINYLSFLVPCECDHWIRLYYMHWRPLEMNIYSCEDKYLIEIIFFFFFEKKVNSLFYNLLYLDKLILYFLACIWDNWKWDSASNKTLWERKSWCDNELHNDWNNVIHWSHSNISNWYVSKTILNYKF